MAIISTLIFNIIMLLPFENLLLRSSLDIFMFNQGHFRQLLKNRDEGTKLMMQLKLLKFLFCRLNSYKNVVLKFDN
jgi:hypothetical protein